MQIRVCLLIKYLVIIIISTVNLEMIILMIRINLKATIMREIKISTMVEIVKKMKKIIMKILMLIAIVITIITIQFQCFTLIIKVIKMNEIVEFTIKEITIMKIMTLEKLFITIII